MYFKKNVNSIYIHISKFLFNIFSRKTSSNFPVIIRQTHFQHYFHSQTRKVLCSKRMKRKKKKETKRFAVRNRQLVFFSKKYLNTSPCSIRSEIWQRQSGNWFLPYDSRFIQNASSKLWMRKYWSFYYRITFKFPSLFLFSRVDHLGLFLRLTIKFWHFP